MGSSDLKACFLTVTQRDRDPACTGFTGRSVCGNRLWNRAGHAGRMSGAPSVPRPSVPLAAPPQPAPGPASRPRGGRRALEARRAHVTTALPSLCRRVLPRAGCPGRHLSWWGSPPPPLFLSARDSQLSFSLPFELFPFFSPNFPAPQPTCSLSIFSCFPCAALLRDLRLERLSGVACVAPGGTSSLVDSRMVHPQSSDLTAANSCLKSPFSLSFPQAASLKDKWGLGYKPSYNRSKTITASGRPPLKRMERAR